MKSNIIIASVKRVFFEKNKKNTIISQKQKM